LVLKDAVIISQPLMTMEIHTNVLVVLLRHPRAMTGVETRDSELHIFNWKTGEKLAVCVPCVIGSDTLTNRCITVTTGPRDLCI
jgi:hypothetical protein